MESSECVKGQGFRRVALDQALAVARQEARPPEFFQTSTSFEACTPSKSQVSKLKFHSKLHGPGRTDRSIPHAKVPTGNVGVKCVLRGSDSYS